MNPAPASEAIRFPAAMAIEQQSRWGELVRREWVWGIVFLALPIHLFFAREGFTAANGLLAWILFAFCILMADRELRIRPRLTPVLPMALIQTYIFFGLAVFGTFTHWTVWGIIWFPAEVVAQTQMLVLLGTLALVIGFDVIQRWMAGNPTVMAWHLRGDELGGAGVFAAYALAWVGISLLIKVAAFRGSMPDVLSSNLIGALFNLEICVSLLVVLAARQSSKAVSLISQLVVLLAATVGALSGMLENLLRPLLIAALGVHHFRTIIRARTVVILIAIVVLYSPLKYGFREIAWRQGLGAIARVRALSDSYERTWSGGQLSENVETTQARFSDLIGLTHVVAWVPDTVAYRGAETIRPLVVFAVPRFLWKNKPDMSALVYNDYAIRFGRTTFSGLSRAQFSISAFGEGFWMSGVIGVFVALFFVGIYFAFVAILCRPNSLVGQVFWLTAPILVVRMHASATWMFITTWREALVQAVIISFVLVITGSLRTKTKVFAGLPPSVLSMEGRPT